MLKITKEDIGKILKGGGIAALAGFLTYFLGYLNAIDIDVREPIIYSLLGTLVNGAQVLAKKYLPEN